MRDADLHPLFGSSQPMRELSEQVRTAAANSQPVLVVGEVGVGKSRVARAIHALSPRASEPFRPLECVLRPEAALRAKYTEAMAGARNGTFFLEEVAGLPESLQTALLDTQIYGTDARIITSTSRDLATEVTEQRFNELLYYRLGAIAINLPPLRLRAPEDIRDLAASLIDELRAGLPDSPRAISDRAIALLVSYHWPGNIRELRNVLERALLRSAGADELDLVHFPPEVLEVGSGMLVAHMQRKLSDVERNHIERTLRAHGGNRTHAAKALGISRATLIKKIRDFEAADRTAAHTQENA